jgi:hypothetical protein
MLIREGSKETALVKEIQEVVGAKPIDGIFGKGTTAKVMQWQREHHLVVDGIVGPKTLELMEIIDTDLDQQFYDTEEGLRIHRHFLPQGEYIVGPIKNDYVFIHHTSGWHNPFKVIDSWGRDSRGRIATEFVVGGQKITDGNSDYDGQVVQAFPEGGQGWHLGKTGSSHMNRHSVGIEMCAFGYLKHGKTYTGTTAKEDQISTLDFEFRGYSQWHKYSDAQIEATGKLLEFIADRDQIDIREGLVEWIRKFGPEKAFGFQQDAYEGNVKGLLTHTNVRKDKTDDFPQPELIDMLLSL